MRIRPASRPLQRGGRRPRRGWSAPTRWRRRTTRPGRGRSTRRAQPAWRATSTTASVRCRRGRTPAPTTPTSSAGWGRVAWEGAWAGGYRLSRDFYLGDRAMRESGFDPSFRFGPFSGATHHYAPVCLNSLLYRYERDLAHFAHLLAKPQEALRWERGDKAHLAAIQRYLWRQKEGVFADFDFIHAKSSSYAYITSLYPLWARVATREESKQFANDLTLSEPPAGLSLSNPQT